MEAYAMLLAAEKSHGQLVALIDKNYHQISERLNLLVATLSKVVLSVPRKEGRRELVMRIHEQTQHSLKALKKVKRQCLNYEYTLHRLHDYYFPTWRLEASKSNSWPRELDDHEIRLIEHGMKIFGTKNDEYEPKIKTAFVFNESSDDLERKQLKRHDVEKLFFIDLDRRSVAWDLRSCIGLCDRKAMSNYREDAVRIFKDIAVFTNDAVEGTRFFILPMVKCDKHSRKFRFDNGKDEGTEAAPLNDDFGTIPAAGEHIEVEADFISKGHIELAHWHELELAVLLLVEIQFSGHVLFEDLRSPHTFEDRFTAQIKKLKSLGIDLKLEMKATTLKPAGEVADVDVPASNDDLPADGGKKAKVKKVEDLLNNAADLPRDRWRRQPPFSGSRRLSLRDPLELALTFSKPPIFVDNMDLCTTVTSLDISGQNSKQAHFIEKVETSPKFNLFGCKLQQYQPL
uniref:Mediator complex subunit 17 n=1 Tax=Panagrellus redivivus TaxID=6233 RepID=A0A7E4VW24_PANRE